MVRQHMEEVRSSSGSICRIRPSAVPVGRKTSPNKGIHPAYQGYSSETPSQKIFSHYRGVFKRVEGIEGAPLSIEECSKEVAQVTLVSAQAAGELPVTIPEIIAALHWPGISPNRQGSCWESIVTYFRNTREL